MNIARCFVTKGFATIRISQTTRNPSLKKILPCYTIVQHQRNYTRKYSQPSTITQLETKLNKLENYVLSTPGKYTTSDPSAPSPKPLKKRVRPLRKKQPLGASEINDLGYFNVTAFATAEEYDLEKLLDGIKAQNLYTAKKYFSTDSLGEEQDVLYCTAKYQVDDEGRDVIFFREGSVVLWNFNEMETNNVLTFLRQYEKSAYLQPLVRGESEMMPYTYVPESTYDVEGDLVADADQCTTAFFEKGKFYLTCGHDNFLEKYTFSNAMATSIKLGIWEATLERYITSIEFLTEDLKKGKRLRISRGEVLRKTGELFALKHVINLSSDCLDTPDFYWDREDLENLYLQVCSYFSIARRTRVMNEKISHCVELAELVSTNLNDAHHIRLEWMIIILIMVEVAFETVHYMDRFWKEDENVAAVVAAPMKKH